MATRRFECIEGTSKKFWEISVDGAVQVVRFGRLGTDGQRDEKKLGSPADAKASAEKLVAQKVKKGYREVAPASNGKATPPKAPAVAAKKGSPKLNLQLLDAVKAGDVKAAAKLLGAGAGVDCTDDKGATPLMWAAREGNEKLVRVLLDAGASPNARMTTDAGSSALSIAVRRGHVGVVNQLLGAGCDLKGPIGTFALQRAGEKGRLELMLLLGRAGAGNTDHARAFREALGFLCESKPEKELLEAISYRVSAVKKVKGGLAFIVGDEVIQCAAPAKAKSKPHVPASYRAIAERFNGITWASMGGGRIGYSGLTPEGEPTHDWGWDSSYLKEASNPGLEKSLSAKKLSLDDLTPAFGCAQNWLLFDPTRKNKHGEPALGFVSHESCEWAPVKSADKKSSAGVLLALMGQYFAGAPGLDEVSL
jgi:predicted DNA-binding WGR domain protein